MTQTVFLMNLSCKLNIKEKKVAMLGNSMFILKASIKQSLLRKHKKSGLKKLIW